LFDERRPDEMGARNVNALAVTAHHDDAFLWLGGTILRTTQVGWGWTVIALCVPDGSKREYFSSWCDSVGAHSVVNQFLDYQPPPAFRENQKSDIQRTIEIAVGDKRFDWVFTHSRDPGGEYGGHANHDEVQLCTTDLVKQGRLCEGMHRLAYFCYFPIFGRNGRATAARPDADFHLQLNYDQLSRKCAWCTAAPDSLTSLKNIGYPCPNPEAFSGEQLQLPEPFIPRDCSCWQEPKHAGSQ
jgi:hypothetical protein